MNLQQNILLTLRVLLVLVILACLGCSSPFTPNTINTDNKNEIESRRAVGAKNRMCVKSDETVRARHKSCLLRPDTGPCRADILSWYFDAKAARCYRFFWGGCQGNGNRYINRRDCINYCYLNKTIAVSQIPHFCSLPFDFGTCYGQYNRWGWDPMMKACRRRLYSGCGGNQNNFETRQECLATCLLGPNNTMNQFHAYTTCIPFTLPDSN